MCRVIERSSTLESLEQLREREKRDPAGFITHLCEQTKLFVLGVEDHRQERGLTWGGGLRVVLNRNIAIHLVEAFNSEMEEPGELPQFTVFPDAKKAGRDHPTEVRVEDVEEPIRGVVFWVTPEAFRKVRSEVASLADRYGDFDLIPDSWLAGTALATLLETRILEHAVVKDERQYDFRRGILHGALPASPPPPPDDGTTGDAADAFLAQFSGPERGESQSA